MGCRRTQYGRNFLIIVDRHSAWSPEHNGGKEEGTQGLISALYTYLATLGISMEIDSDGGPDFTASATKRFLRDLDVRHRQSSAHLPHSNHHTELGSRM